MAGTFRYTLNADYDAGNSASIATSGGSEISSLDTRYYRFGPDGILLNFDAFFYWLRGSPATSYLVADDAVTTNSGVYADWSGNTVSAEFYGAARHDELVGGQAADLLSGRGGNDTLTGNGGADTLNGGAGADTMNGGSEVDTATYAGSSAGVTVDLDAGTGLGGDAAGDTLSAMENLIGSGQSDRLTGDGDGNVLAGGGGNDILNGATGADTMQGGTGNDVFVVDDVGDVVTEAAGEGLDMVVASIDFTLSATFEGLILAGTAVEGTGNGGSNAIIGNAEDNTLSGLGGMDRLDGGLGADTMEGGDGSDAYVVDDAGDIVTELTGEGTDTVTSGVSFTLSDNVERLTLAGAAIEGTGNGLNNLLTGNGEDNVLRGLGGDDRIDGGAGGDTLFGGAGRDALTGGLGADTFTFESLADGTDTIRDFAIAEDIIAIAASLVGRALGALDDASFAANARGRASEADDRIVYSTQTGALWIDADGSGSGAAVLIARITGAPTLTAAHFELI